MWIDPNVDYVHSTFHNVGDSIPKYDNQLSVVYNTRVAKLRTYINNAAKGHEQIVRFLQVSDAKALQIIKKIVDPKDISQQMDLFKSNIKTVQRDLNRLKSNKQTSKGQQIWTYRIEGNNIIYTRYRKDNRLQFVKHFGALQKSIQVFAEVAEAAKMIQRATNVEDKYRTTAKEITSFINQYKDVMNTIASSAGITSSSTKTEYTMSLDTEQAITTLANALYGSNKTNFNVLFGTFGESLSVEEIQPLIDQKINEIERDIQNSFDYNYNAVGVKNQAIDATLKFYETEQRNSRQNSGVRTQNLFSNITTTINISIKNVSTSLAPRISNGNGSPTKYGYTDGVSLGSLMGGDLSAICDMVTLTNLYVLGHFPFYPNDESDDGNEELARDAFDKAIYSAAIDNFTDHMGINNPIHIVYYSGNIYWYDEYLTSYFAPLMTGTPQLDRLPYVKTNANSVINVDPEERYANKINFLLNNRNIDDFKKEYSAYDKTMSGNIDEMKNVTLQHALWAFSKNGVYRSA